MKLDFRTKAAIMLLVATAASLNTKAYVEIIMVAALVILELLLGKRAFTPVLLAVYAVFVAVQYLILPNVPEVVSMILSMLVVNIRSFLPYKAQISEKDLHRICDCSPLYAEPRAGTESPAGSDVPSSYSRNRIAYRMLYGAAVYFRDQNSR